MNIYLVMGTHLMEIRHCLRHLAGADKENGPVEIHVPAGLEWDCSEETFYELKVYPADPEPWVFDPDAEGTVFIILDPRESPIHQLEFLAEDLGNCLLEPVKIITFVDCTAAENTRHLRAYYDACIYYSDLVLLGNRSGTSKSFLRDFAKEYERKCYPCLFLPLKGPGIPSQPMEILTPDTRRISRLFDLAEPEDDSATAGMIIEASCDLDLEEEEIDPFRSPESEAAMTAPIPDVSQWIVPASEA